MALRRTASLIARDAAPLTRAVSSVGTTNPTPTTQTQTNPTPTTQANPTPTTETPTAQPTTPNAPSSLAQDAVETAAFFAVTHPVETVNLVRGTVGICRHLLTTPRRGYHTGRRPNNRPERAENKTPQEASLTEAIFSFFDALGTGVQGIGVTQGRAVIGQGPGELPEKTDWNCPHRRTFQIAIEMCEAKSPSATNQRNVILRNNIHWDNDGHPFAETSIVHFVQQIYLLNHAHEYPQDVAEELRALERLIQECFNNELGPHGQAAVALHGALAIPATHRIEVMYGHSSSPDDLDPATVVLIERRRELTWPERHRAIQAAADEIIRRISQEQCEAQANHGQGNTR